MEAVVHQGLDERPLREEGVRRDQFRYRLKLVPERYQVLPVPFDQVVAHLLEAPGVGRLEGGERRAFVVLDVQDPDPRDLESGPRRPRRAGPELPEPGCPVARLGDEARVHADGLQPAGAQLARQVQVEREPVEVVTHEGVPVGLFHELPVSPHLQEVDPVRNRHEEFHDIHEYFLEWFA